MADKKPDESSKVFTFDPESEGDTEVPSLTRLLNRKSLSQKKPPATGSLSPPQTPSPPPAPQAPGQSTDSLPSSAATLTPPPAPPVLEKKEPPSLEIQLAEASPSPPLEQPAQKISTPPPSPQTPGQRNEPSNEGEIELEGIDLPQTQPEPHSAPPENASPQAIHTPPPSSDSVQLSSEISLELPETESQPSSPTTPAPALTPQSAPATSESLSLQTPSIRTVLPLSPQSKATEIKKWDLQTLSQSQDPLGKAIAQLSEHGADSALFFSITPPEGKSSTPFFKSTAAVHADRRIPIWSGVKWKPELSKDLWNAFLKSGQVELDPYSTPSPLTPVKNAMRAALGARPSEWLILVRVGSAHACRGVIAFFSKRSLLPELPPVLPLLNSDLPK